MVQITKQLQEQRQRLENLENLFKQNKSICMIDEASEFTGLSKSTIYKLTSIGKIPHYKKCKHLYFDKDKLLLWIKSNEKGGLKNG